MQFPFQCIRSASVLQRLRTQLPSVLHFSVSSYRSSFSGLVNKLSRGQQSRYAPGDEGDPVMCRHVGLSKILRSLEKQNSIYTSLSQTIGTIIAELGSRG